MADISANFLGIKSPNPYWLASAPPTDKKINVLRAFEAGWGPHGAVCVARTRWSELLPLSVLLASAPRLVARPCDEAEARRRGAVLFNRSKLRPGT